MVDITQLIDQAEPPTMLTLFDLNRTGRSTSTGARYERGRQGRDQSYKPGQPSMAIVIPASGVTDKPAGLISWDMLDHE